MLKKLVNEAHFKLLIQTIGSVLVKSGHVTISGPDMTPMLTYRDGDWQVYLPGSSLKGVFRSHLEKVCRTLHEGVVCNPFLKLKDITRIENGRLTCSDYASVACNDKLEVRKDEKFEAGDQTKWRHLNPEILTNQQVYTDCCPICRLFGSTSYIGRVSIGDAYLVNATHPRPTELRDGVGIDRLTGGASRHAKFELEVISPGTAFETEIYLRNFETWQLGMLMLVAQDMADELVSIGSGRSRGLGAVKGQVDRITISHFGNVNGKTVNEVWGLGKFLQGEDRYTRYGTWFNDLLTIEPASTETRLGIRLMTTFEGDSLGSLQDKSIAAFVQRVQSWEVPETMTFEYLQCDRG
jgi:CRISPR-associated RAMP protein (TIGR02581 family)